MNSKTIIPTTGYVRLPQILQVYSVSKSTWWNGVKEGKYPKSVKLGKRVTAWRSEDINALINSHQHDGGKV